MIRPTFCTIDLAAAARNYRAIRASLCLLLLGRRLFRRCPLLRRLGRCFLLGKHPAPEGTEGFHRWFSLGEGLPHPRENRLKIRVCPDQFPHRGGELGHRPQVHPPAHEDNAEEDQTNEQLPQPPLLP